MPLHKRLSRWLLPLILLALVLTSGAVLAGPFRQGDSAGVRFGYTYQRADGNRYALGSGGAPFVEPLDIPLGGLPDWAVAAPTENGGSIWVVTLQAPPDDTTGLRPALAFEVQLDGAYRPIDLFPDQLPALAPPYLAVADGLPSLYAALHEEALPATHPVVLPDSQRLVMALANGDLLFLGGEEEVRLPVNALPDARILVDEHERLLLLTDPTTRYDHGILGDTIEAAAITLVETVPAPRIALTIPIPEPQVIEGLAPIWADLDGDGVREIVVTVSDGRQGAQLQVYSEDGQIAAVGPAIGQGYRWRHPIAAAPFGPGGELELVDVLTPHIGGVVEFFRWEGAQLIVTARVPGYTSHLIGSRNLDMSAAADFDGDGRVELLVPTQDRAALGGIRRTVDGAEVAWTLSLDGRAVTNLATVSFADGGLAVGVGLENGALRIWLPE